ncbi:MAG: aminopeptidase P family protein [Candidatus Woesearchaeota archaeon]
MKLVEFQAYLKEKKINKAIFFYPDSHITYFTQIQPSFAFLVISPANTELYLTKLDGILRIKGIKVKIMSKNWQDKLIDSKVKKVGINKKALTLHLFDKLKKIYPQAKFVDIGSKVVELRSEKTHLEIKMIAKACEITTGAFNALVQELPHKKLRTEQQVACFLENHIKNKGAELAFPTIVAMGKNASIPHHKISNKNLCRGVLLLDFGAKWKNYCSDMSRVLFLGKPTKEEQDCYQLLLEAQTGTLKQIKENKLFIELNNHARKILGNFAGKFTHGLGHGVGIDIHESPIYATDKVQKGQVFTIEPGVYFQNKFGLRIEDTILFDGKIKILTKASKELSWFKDF